MKEKLLLLIIVKCFKIIWDQKKNALVNIPTSNTRGFYMLKNRHNTIQGVESCTSEK